MLNFSTPPETPTHAQENPISLLIILYWGLFMCMAAKYDQVQAAEMRTLRLTKGITRRYRVRNEGVQWDLEVESISWKSLTDSNWNSLAMQESKKTDPVQGTTGGLTEGRPWEAWVDNTKAASIAIGTSLKEVDDREVFRARGRWRAPHRQALISSFSFLFCTVTSSCTLIFFFCFP